MVEPDNFLAGRNRYADFGRTKILLQEKEWCDPEEVEIWNKGG